MKTWEAVDLHIVCIKGLYLKGEDISTRNQSVRSKNWEDQVDDVRYSVDKYKCKDKSITVFTINKREVCIAEENE